VIPEGPPFAKRLVVDNGFFDMLNDTRNELVDTPIERFTRRGILTKDGQERHFDIIVLACGFQVTKYFHPVQYVGRDGRTFEKEWAKDGARSYLGLVNPGAANL
jgi:4-hydroxyacetophenone monooxygenase